MSIEITRGTGTQLATDDLEAALDRFLRLNVAEGDASPHTLRAYKAHLVGHDPDAHQGKGLPWLAWCLAGGITPALASVEDVKEYRSYLTAMGYTRSSIAMKLQALRRFYEAAQAWGWREDNPAAGLKPPQEKTERYAKILEVYIDPADIDRLLNAPDPDTEQGIRDRAILTLLYYHGLRVAEVGPPRYTETGEQVSGLSLDDYALGPPRLRIHGKGQKIRHAFLTDDTQAALEAWLGIRVVTNGTRAVFTTLERQHRGTALSTRGIRKRVDKYLEETGLKAAGLSCHALRHAYGTHLAMAGLSPYEIAVAMGHAKIDTTMHYVNAAKVVQENPTARLEAWKKAREGF